MKASGLICKNQDKKFEIQMKLYKWIAIASDAVNIKTRKTLFHADKIFPVKPLVPLRDQDPIFSHNINITGSSQVMRIKKNIN